MKSLFLFPNSVKTSGWQAGHRVFSISDIKKRSAEKKGERQRPRIKTKEISTIKSNIGKLGVGWLCG